MSDRDKMIKLFNELHIDYTWSNGTDLKCSEGSTNIVGYIEFFTLFTFDIDGKFIEMGAYE